MNPEEYISLVEDTHKLIMSEFDRAKTDKNLYMIYPKLVTMYEFFRLLRGESFTDVRPPTPEKQKEFYKMEDEIGRKLQEIKSSVDFNDEKVKLYIEEAQKYYT